MPAIDQRLGFDRIVRFNYYPGWHQPFTAFHLAVNPAAWSALSDAQRALVETSCTAGVTRNLARGESLQGRALQTFRESGVSVSRLPEEILRELQRMSNIVLDEEARRDSGFHRVLASQRSFSAEYQSWKSLGFLPRDF